MSDSYWNWRDRLANANDPAFWPIETIDEMLVNGTAQFWCDGTSAVVTCLETFPGGALVVKVLSGAGTSESIWREIAPRIEAFGREKGARAIHILGRLGWERSSRPEGWNREMVLLVKELPQ